MGETSEISAELITKKCTKCGEVKALDDFNANKYSRDGRRPDCRTCCQKQRDRNRSANAERAKAYRAKNRKLLSEKSRQYQRDNIEKVRQYYVENKLRLAEYRREYRKSNPEAQRRANRKRRALKRSLPHAPLTPAQYERLYEFRDQVFGGVTS